jgi:hypothetical protein
MADVALLLNEHSEAMIGIERYSRVAGLLDPFLLDPVRLVEPVMTETRVRGELLYRRLAMRASRGTVTCVGDCSAAYIPVLPELVSRFPHGRIVIVVREPEAVAAELQRRAEDPLDLWPATDGVDVVTGLWNESLSRIRELTLRRPGARVLLLPFEAFIEGDAAWFRVLLAFARLPVTARVESEYERLVARHNTPTPSVGVGVDRDAELDRWRTERTARPPTGVAEVALDPSDDEPPLTDDEIDVRQAEREQLFVEIARGSAPRDDDLDVLGRRYAAQTRELVRRSSRLEGARRGAVQGLPPTELRVTLICPHQRPTTGGVYAIEQLASHLAALVSVRLLVRKPPVRRLPGVEVWVDQDLSAACRDTDVVVFPADMEDAGRLELDRADVRPIMLLQGFGTPGNPVVLANLARASEVVATSAWLAALAREHGAAAVYLPYGLDRGVFAPGRPTAERTPLVSAMTHQVDWKGGEDLLAAIAQVRHERPDAKVTLYGRAPAQGGDTFLLRPPRTEVAELLARSAVHVVSSWEEGFGLPGAEALACGAALATTDTKGSRDYAIHHRTALVSPPRDPGALAANILELLGDASLRGRLAGAGLQHVRALLPPWPEVARRFALLLGERA